jgi:hypothetical protein
MTLDAEDLKAIEALIEARIQALTPKAEENPHVLTVERAIPYVGKRSATAFHSWTKAHRVQPVSRGRYSRTRLDLALSREARGLRH